MLFAKLTAAPVASNKLKSLSSCKCKLVATPLLSLPEREILPFSIPFTSADNVPAAALYAKVVWVAVLKRDDPSDTTLFTVSPAV